jgi:NADPH:quinone reductase-like Zn-dependent oxidoreductase
VLIGLLGGARAELDLTRFIGKRLTLTGSVLRPRPLEQKLELVRRFAPRVLPLFDANSVRPVIDRSYSWTEVVGAHARMERNANFGKIVLRID